VVFLALLLGVTLVLAYLGLAVQLATPPALVPGDRLVLADAALPPPAAGAVRFGPPLVPEDRAFFLLQPERGEAIAVRAAWQQAGAPVTCPVTLVPPGPRGERFRAECPDGERTFGARGEPITAPRGLDRYLVSREGERVIVNLSRAIRGFGSTPQPRVSPLP